MAKLSKANVKQHEAALRLLEKERLTIEERYFVLENWREDAQHMNSKAGAFFTPEGLARDAAVEVTGKYVIDMCAGIGALAFACWMADPTRRITCVEINRDYFEVGRKVLPEAVWINGDVFDYSLTGRYSEHLEWDLASHGKYDCAVSNPPFGNVATHKNVYGSFEYDVVHKAREVARDGVFILPQMILPFRYSGNSHMEEARNPKYEKFSAATGIQLSMNCGMDTSLYRDEWTIKPPAVEIALGFEVEE